MSIRLGVVMDPIETINLKKDSTIAMLWAASDRGWQLFYMNQQDLHLVDGQAMASARQLSVFRDPQAYYSLAEPEDIELADLDVILMRKDPPFDNEYIYSTYILEAAERLGTLIINKPQSLRDSNEKIFATQFPQCCPPLLVSRDPKKLREFHNKHQDVIFKPLDGMGGSSIFRVKSDDPNLAVILETLTNFGNHTIMAQRFIPEIKDGDKRILLINGEPVPYCLARVPAVGETRGNLAAGGTGRAQPLSDRDRSAEKKIKSAEAKTGQGFGTRQQPPVQQSTVQRNTAKSGTGGILESLFSGVTKSKKGKDTPLDKFMKSAMSSIGTQVGRSVVRGLLGSISK